MPSILNLHLEIDVLANHSPCSRSLGAKYMLLAVDVLNICVRQPLNLHFIPYLVLSMHRWLTVAVQNSNYLPFFVAEIFPNRVKIIQQLTIDQGLCKYNWANHDTSSPQQRKYEEIPTPFSMKAFYMICHEACFVSYALQPSCRIPNLTDNYKTYLKLIRFLLFSCSILIYRPFPQF